MENKQTAIGWLIEKTTESGHLWLTDKPYGMDELDLIIEQAKQIEKEQIIEAFKHGELPPLFVNYNAEQYYQQTYNKS